MNLTPTTANLRLLLFLAIFIALNLLAYQAFFRLDFTADQRYTLSDNSEEILEDLDRTVQVTAYFSENLPPELDRVRRDLQDMLVEYRSLADGQLEYDFVDPTADEEGQAEQQAQQMGIAPLDIQSREKDQIKVLRGYMGAVVSAGGQQEVIARFNQDGSGMEYALSSAIKKLTLDQLPRVGLITGHGEPGLPQLQQVQQEMRGLYQLDTVRLSDPQSWSSCRTLLLLGPSDIIPQEELDQLDQFLASGGRLVLGVNAVGGDLQGRRPWQAVTTGLGPWLMDKGISVGKEFLIDANCAQLQLQQQRGTFTQIIPVDFYYYPYIQDFADHPVTDGLEQMLLLFASPLALAELDSGLTATVLARSSELTGTEAPPTFFDPNREWTRADFPQGPQPVAMALSGHFGGSAEGKLLVIGDGDFATNPSQQQRTLPDNVNFLVNAIDWLSDDTGLIELRTKQVLSRRLDTQLSEGERSTVKWLNFLLPILIVVVVGMVRTQRRKAQRLRWQAESYRDH